MPPVRRAPSEVPGVILDMFGLAVKTIVEMRFRAGIVVV
jgi:hypothetical protein